MTTPRTGVMILPNGANNLNDDVLRLIAAINKIDTDVAAAFLAIGMRAALEHTHPPAQIVGLDAALDDLSPKTHTHALGDLSNVTAPGSPTNKFLKFVGAAWSQPASPSRTLRTSRAS